MLDLRYVLDHLDEVRAMLARRSPAAAASLDGVAALAARRSALIQAVEGLRREQNAANQAMAASDKQSPEFAARRDELKQLSQRAKALKVEQDELDGRLTDELLGIPNLPHADTPEGRDESANVFVRAGGDKPRFDFAPKDHVELGTALGIMDFERAAKISGARFTVLRGAGARLERALMSLMLDLHVETHGYTEIWPPALVLASAMRGTGQLPKFAAESFRIAADWERAAAESKQTEQAREFYLVPTAEVPVTNLHAGEILEAEALPIKYCAYSPCFRSEAGSYGKDTRGMFRQHQFDKVELVRFERPEDGQAALEELTRDAERVLQRLGLHYRVMALCAGDMGASAQKAYDLEVWLPGQDSYREISSCSWFGEYQARRAKIRYRPARGEKPRMLHTLNGSGLAIGRTVIAILEQNQRADGSVRLPSALVPYMGGLEVLRSTDGPLP